MKKAFLRVSSVFLSVFLFFPLKVAVALPMGMHYYVGTKVLDRLCARSAGGISVDCANAFLSACCLADIGRIKLDAETKVESDKPKFIETVSKLAKTDEEKWFALGLKAHFLVDEATSTFLEGIFGKPEKPFVYFSWYGVLDNYFITKTSSYFGGSDFNKYSINEIFAALPDRFKSLKYKLLKIFLKPVLYFINPASLLKYFRNDFKNEVILSCKCSDLLKAAYSLTAGCNISVEEIQKQIGNLLVASVLLCIKERNAKLDEVFKKRVDARTNELVNYVVDKMSFDIR